MKASQNTQLAGDKTKGELITKEEIKELKQIQIVTEVDTSQF